MTTVSAVLGWTGAACLVLAYALLAAGRIRTGCGYHLLNLAGSLGLAVNAASHRAWPSAALNLLWLGIGLVALRRLGTHPSVRTDQAHSP
jgi:hypothetical protein